MEPLEILREINNRFLTAVVFHTESADLFHFLALPGFAALHEYQCFDESKTQRELKRYILENYNDPVYDSMELDPNIFRPLTEGKQRIGVQSDDKWNTIKVAWEQYYKWESETKAEYSEMAKQLLDRNAVSDYEFVSKIVVDVSKELQTLTGYWLDMKGNDFDMPHISDLQEPMKIEYEKKLERLFKR